MTDRLYYDNSYLLDFDATVTSVHETADGSFVLYLDRSAFYPTSGGQPYDTGTIGSANVTDVYVDDCGDVAHVTDRFIATGSRVSCSICRERRFDHMQQHAGEHILAGCIYRELGGHTIGLHLGHDSSSIDVELPDGRTHLSPDEISMLEDEVNLRIQKDVPIKCWFPDEAELASLPLRKPPTVTSHVRIVKIGEDEYCACGGTHPDSAGQIGLFKIIDVRPSRGKVRFTFLCGKRAFEYLRICYNALCEVNNLTSSTAETVAANVGQLITRLKDTEYRLQNEITATAIREAVHISAEAPVINGVRFIQHVFEGLDFEALTSIASGFIAENKSIALLASRSASGLLLLFARSSDIGLNMSAIIKRCGAKGGGKPDFARGSAADETALNTAYGICAEELA